MEPTTLPAPGLSGCPSSNARRTTSATPPKNHAMMGELSGTAAKPCSKSSVYGLDDFNPPFRTPLPYCTYRCHHGQILFWSIRFCFIPERWCSSKNYISLKPRLFAVMNRWIADFGNRIRPFLWCLQNYEQRKNLHCHKNGMLHLGLCTVWLVVYLPLWKIWKSVGMMTFPTKWKK